MSWGPSRRVSGLRRTRIREIFDAAPPGAINLGLGQPDLPTPASMSLAGVAAVSSGQTGYTSTAGLPSLRAAVAAHHRPFVSSAEQVVITVGSQEAMYAACLALTDPGDEVLYPDPGYPAYPTVAQLVGAIPVAYPLHAREGFRLQAHDVLERVGARTRLVILCAPSNPTGAYHRRDQLERLLPELERREIPWVSDEIYAGFRYAPEFVSPAEIAPTGGLIVAGLSKDSCMTGWRIGWAAGPEPIVRRILAVHQYLVTCAPGPSQHAAVAAFADDGCRARQEILERFRSRRQLMADELARISGLAAPLPDGAFYFFVPVAAYGDSSELAARLLQRRQLITIPGEAFGEQGRGYLRISFAASEQAIVEGIRRMACELRHVGG